jgi:hypothetical protein
MHQQQDELSKASSLAGRLFVQLVSRREERAVARRRSVGALDSMFLHTLRDRGIGVLAAVREFETAALPHAARINHPLYCGLVNSTPLPAAPLADLLVSALNNNAGASHQSGALLAAEREVIRAFRGLLSLSRAWVGMVLPAGTLATLQALVMARTAAFPTAHPATNPVLSFLV